MDNMDIFSLSTAAVRKTGALATCRRRDLLGCEKKERREEERRGRERKEVGERSVTGVRHGLESFREYILANPVRSQVRL
jgi:hypothetical protein